MIRRLNQMCRSLPRRVAVAAVVGYQVMIRPFLVGSCKYYPTCSDYAIEAFSRHGLLRGARFTIGRLLRCHPFAAGGLDPAPPSRAAESERPPVQPATAARASTTPPGHAL